MIYATDDYPKPLGSWGGVPKDLELHVGILVLVCQELVLQDFISRVMTLTFIKQTALLWDGIWAELRFVTTVTTGGRVKFVPAV